MEDFEFTGNEAREDSSRCATKEKRGNEKRRRGGERDHLVSADRAVDVVSFMVTKRFDLHLELW